MLIFHIDLSRKAHEKFIVCGKKILHHLVIIIIFYVLITSLRRFSLVVGMHKSVGIKFDIAIESTFGIFWWGMSGWSFLTRLANCTTI